MSDPKQNWREIFGISSADEVEEIGTATPPEAVGYGFAALESAPDRPLAPLTEAVEAIRAEPSFIEELALTRRVAAHVPGLCLDFARHDPRFVVAGGAEPRLVVGDAVYAEELGGLLRLTPDSLGALVYEAGDAQVWVLSDGGVLRAERVVPKTSAWGKTLDAMRFDEAELPAVPQASSLLEGSSVAPWLLERVRELEARQSPLDSIAALGHVARFALSSASSPRRTLERLVAGEMSSPAERVAEIARTLGGEVREAARDIAFDRVDRLLDSLEELEELAAEASPDAAPAARRLRLERNALASAALVLRCAGESGLEGALAGLDEKAEVKVDVIDAAAPAEDEELVQAAIEGDGIWWGPPLG